MIEEKVAESFLDKTCSHCGDLLGKKTIDGENGTFCCQGCYFAYQLIKNSGLDYFYEIRKNFLDKAEPVKAKEEDLSYLDQKDVRKKFEVEENTIDFYIEGVECSACIWLIEKLVLSKKEVLSARTHGSQNIIRLQIRENASYAPLLKEINQLGYSLKPLDKAEDYYGLRDKKRRKNLKQIAVAAVFAGNIMLLSFADYFGADLGFAQAFRWLSFVLVLPIVFYSAAPILKKSFLSLINNRPSLDLPISIAFSAGLTLSLYSLIVGLDTVYFDSISILILLILSSRYLVNRYKEDCFEKANLYIGAFPNVVKKVVNNDTNYALLKNIKKEDRIQAVKGDSLAVDGFVIEGNAWLDESVLSGESYQRFVAKKSKVFAGSKIEKGDIIISVDSVGEESRIGRILKKSSLNAMFKSQVKTIEEQFATYFTWFVASLSLFTFYFYWPSWQIAFDRSLSLLIVACPCAIAFGSPVLYARIIKKINEYGIYIKETSVLQKIEAIKNLAFDKTGTLTKGSFKVCEFVLDNRDDRLAIVSLESMSAHPIAKALLNHLDQDNIYKEVKGFQIIPKLGVEGYIGKDHYKIISENFSDDFIKINFYKNQQWMGYAKLQDEIKKEARKLKETFKNLKLSILSGDHQFLVKRIAELSNITNYKYSLSPEEKEMAIKKNTMMIGDGINDTAALAKADIGLVVGGNIEKAFRYADVFFVGKNFLDIKKLWTASIISQKAHLYMFAFSFTYNLFAAALAFMGYIHPLLAAILMPLSSIFILLLVQFYTRGALWK